jgi:hypothetical protein
MTTIGREEIKNNPAYREIFEGIKKHHVVPEHTIKELLKNKHVKDFCVEARHFVALTGERPIYLHYDVYSWYHKDGALIRIESITFYDNFIEYQANRLKALYASPDSDGINLN